MALQLLEIKTVPDVVEQVYVALLDAMCEGGLPPGTRLMQDEIASALKVSRQRVVQALRLLKRDRFVLDAPGRGLIVSPLDPELIAQVYEVRIALDAQAARLASRRHSRIDPKLIERGRRAAVGSDVRAMIDADTAFHNAIYDAARNAFLWQAAHLHWRHVRRAMGAVLQSSTLREYAWDHHAAIAEMIAQGEEDKVALAMFEHGRTASQFMADQLAHALRPLDLSTAVR